MRSGMVTALILGVVALTFVLAYRQHMQGNFHRLKQRIVAEHPQATIPLPGGQEAIELTRARQMEDTVPEFLSVTLLPGRGMNVLQIRAFVPGLGETDLLASPTVEEAAARMTGEGADAGGRYSLNAGGAFEVPWADSLPSTAVEGRERSMAEWEGHAIQLPPAGPPWEGGLMLAAASDSSTMSTLPDGGQAEATFHGFDSRWPSKVDVHVAVLLSGHTVDLTVVARNVGDAAEPVGIGWRPRFSLQKGALSLLRLHVPADSVVEQGTRRNAVPTGRLLPIAHTALDYSQPGGAKLPEDGLDLCFTDLQQGVMDNGPAAELIDPLKGYKLRLTALSPEIKAMRVNLPSDGSYITIGPQFNYPNPLGHEWDKTPGSGMVVLQPAQSTEWKVRLEILPLGGTNGTP